MTETPSNPTPPRKQDRISFLAVFGVLVIVVGSVLFGIYGPRMRQRVLIASGLPLSELIDVMVRDSVICGNLGLWDVDEPTLHPEELRAVVSRIFPQGTTIPPMEAIDWRLLRAEDLQDLLGTGISAVRLTYQGPADEGARILITYLVPDPSRWFHFDALGRQTPLIPGARVDEQVELVEQGRMEVLGTSVLGQENHVLMLIGVGEQLAAAISDQLQGIENEESGEKKVPEPMTAMLRGGFKPMKTQSM